MISRRSTFIKPAWAVAQITRGDPFARGLVEDLCSHGVGHPNKEWLQGKEEHWGVHGCDGCCVPTSTNTQKEKSV